MGLSVGINVPREGHASAWESAALRRALPVCHSTVSWDTLVSRSREEVAVAVVGTELWHVRILVLEMLFGGNSYNNSRVYIHAVLAAVHQVDTFGALDDAGNGFGIRTGNWLSFSDWAGLWDRACEGKREERRRGGELSEEHFVLEGCLRGWKKLLFWREAEGSRGYNVCTVMGEEKILFKTTPLVLILLDGSSLDHFSNSIPQSHKTRLPPSARIYGV